MKNLNQSLENDTIKSRASIWWLDITRINVVKIKYISLTIVALVMISGCTNKQIYEAIQPKYNEAECMELPKSQYDECIQREALSYEEYEKKRKKITND